MENINNTSNEGAQGTESSQGRTFTQDDVNRIVQGRVAEENKKLEKRVAELDMRERRMNAVDELRKNGLPDYLVDALNMNTEEDFQKSLEALKKMKGETAGAGGRAPGEPIPGTIIGTGTPIGVVSRNGSKTDPIRKAFDLV